MNQMPDNPLCSCGTSNLTCLIHNPFKGVMTADFDDPMELISSKELTELRAKLTEPTQPTINDVAIVLRKISECEQFPDKLDILLKFVNSATQGLQVHNEQLMDAVAELNSFDAPKELVDLRVKLTEQEKERDLYALLRGICEEVIDWLGTLSYDGINDVKSVLDHPLTKDIRLKLQQMYEHPLDNKLLIRTDVLEAKLERADAAEAEAAALREAVTKIQTCIESYFLLSRNESKREMADEIRKVVGEALSAARERGKDGK